MRVPAAGSGDRTEGNVNRQAQEPGARRKRDVGWGRRGGARGAGAPRRPRAVSERCDAGCPARTRAVTDAPRAVAARGMATRLWRLRRAETGKGGSARSTKGAGPRVGDIGDTRDPPARPRTHLPRQPLRTPQPRQPGGGGMDSGPRGLPGALLPGQRVGPQRAAAPPRRARAAEPQVSADPWSGSDATSSV